MRSVGTTNRSPALKPAAGSIRRCPRLLTRRQRRPVTVPRAEGHARRPAARVRSLDGAGRHVRRAGARGSASGWSSRRSSSTSRCSSASASPPTSCARRCTTSTDKGGRRLALRPEGTASVVRAFVQHQPADAVEGLVRRAATSATSARRRAATASTGRSASRCSGVDDPDVDVEVIALARRLLPRLSACSGVRLLLNSMGDAETAPRYVEVLRDYLARPRATRSATSSASASRRTRCGSSTRSAPTGRTCIERAPQLAEHLSDDVARALRARCRTGSHALGIPFELAPAARARASTTTRAPRSSSRATRSTPRRTRSAAAVATTGSPRRWAARRRPASASASGIERRADRVRCRGRVPGADAARSTCSSSTGSATPTRGHAAASPSCARRAARPTAPTAAGR